jgi:hypothetical protein
MKVRIQKRAEAAGGMPAATKEEYVPGTGGIEDKSIPIDYWITGEMPNPIIVGKPVMVIRDTRNGVKCLGLFQTSPVTDVTLTTFKTQNSVYDYFLLTNSEEELSLAV